MTDPTERDLRRLTDDARRADAVERRRREQWLRRQAEDEGTYHGLLIDLTERAAVLALHTAAGRVVRGRATALGADFLAVSGAQERTALVPLVNLVAVSPEPGAAPTVGDRPEATSATFASTLSDLVAERPQVTVHTTGASRVAGALWSVGRDFVVVRGLSGDTYVPFAAVNDLSWR